MADESEDDDPIVSEVDGCFVGIFKSGLIYVRDPINDMPKNIKK